MAFPTALRALSTWAALSLCFVSVSKVGAMVWRYDGFRYIQETDVFIDGEYWSNYEPVPPELYTCQSAPDSAAPLPFHCASHRAAVHFAAPCCCVARSNARVVAGNEFMTFSKDSYNRLREGHPRLPTPGWTYNPTVPDDIYGAWSNQPLEAPP